MYRFTYIVNETNNARKIELIQKFKALGDETRLTIVEYLLQKQWLACDFTDSIEKDQTTISRHLKVLSNAGILTSQKDGRNIIYRIKDDKMKETLLKFGLKPDTRMCEKDKTKR